MVWYSHVFQNFPQFVVIHTVNRPQSPPNEMGERKLIRRSIVGIWAEFLSFDSK